jgi:cobalt-zinc-cadmium resistance protein CzcA
MCEKQRLAKRRKYENTEIKLPSGYIFQYGGQFENLQSAKARLMVAVPLALFLILILLYFAFGSIKKL